MRTMNSNPFAAVFPGQGSQSIGMLSGLASDRVVRDTFDEASVRLGYDLWRLIQEGPEEDLNRTDRTQPAMLAAGVAIWRMWRKRNGPLPIVMAGHSLGEYTALVCAGALSYDRAIELVQERGRLMQDAVPMGKGAMAAILGLEDSKVIELCRRAADREIVSAANFNSPGQVVIAGHRAAVERAVALAQEAGARRTVMLPVSVPSHCALMEPAAQRLRKLLGQTAIDRPEIPVVHNADVASYNDAARIQDALARQLHSPVRWVESVRRMKAMGAARMIEFGPGKVLTGLNKRIDGDIVSLSVFDITTLNDALED
jgi:[acyl-carrier-protein] S-malonyltransferase